ncbi:nitrate reductase cytochrome c-type subunit [Bacteroidota bacterium]
MKKLLIYLTVFLLMVSGCKNQDEVKWLSDEDIDMSHELLLSDVSVLTQMPEYSKNRGGESEVIQRAYENAPPLISHRVGGFLPIKVEDNKCLRCHMPDKAPAFKAIPLPETHFTSYRPAVIEVDGVYIISEPVGEVYETNLEHFNNALFNCSQCHVPQSTATVEISNVFDPEYRSKRNKSRSNLIDKMEEGVR